MIIAPDIQPDNYILNANVEGASEVYEVVNVFLHKMIFVILTFTLARESSKTILTWTKRHMRPCDRLGAPMLKY